MSQIRSFNVAEMSTAETMKYLQTAVAPRPIAMASTIDEEGRS